MAGMRSSGSNCLIAEDVFVPEYRVLRVPAALIEHLPAEHADEALYRSALMPFLSLILAGPQLGLGRAALAYVLQKKAASKPISYTFFQHAAGVARLPAADRRGGARLSTPRTCTRSVPPTPSMTRRHAASTPTSSPGPGPGRIPDM